MPLVLSLNRQSEHPSTHRRVRRLAATAMLAVLGTLASSAHAVTGPFMWKGYTWTPTTGGMAGVCQGDPANISVDANGYLHLKIVHNGGSWTASEVFTSATLGFGTYQWQIAGPLDRMDHTVVLGLFPYGPQAGIGQDGTNEIDTEFSFWNDEVSNVNADWGVYPPSAAGMHWEDDFSFSLSGGSAATTRLVWSSAGITGTLMSGFQPIGATQSVLASTSYMPDAGVSDNIPQQALPLGMNLWCYKAPPASGRDVEIVLQDFQFIPEGQTTPTPDAGEGDSASGTDGADDSAGPSSGPDASTPTDAGESDSALPTADAQGSSGGAADSAPPPSVDAASSTDAAPGNGDMASGASSGCGCITAGAAGTDVNPFFVALATGTALLVRARRRRS